MVPGFIKVSLITNHNEKHLFPPGVFDIIVPFSEAIKSVDLRNIINDDSYVGIPNVGGDQASEPLLTGCVP